jgi:hypothetical protein
MNQGPRWVRLMKKSRGRKSRATVPLKGTELFQHIQATNTQVLMKGLGIEGRDEGRGCQLN